MKKNKTVFSAIILIPLFLLFTLVMNFAHLQSHYYLLKISLLRVAFEEQSASHFYLIAKYRLAKKLYQKKLQHSESHLLETKLDALFLQPETTWNIQELKAPWPVFIYLVNLLRSLTGKEELDLNNQLAHNGYLSLAYFFEKNRLYEKALFLYNRSLASLPKAHPERSGVLLHQGFCHAILGNYQEAKKHYLKVINAHVHEKTALTAALLLQYLEGFQKEKMKILSAPSGALEKSEKLLDILAAKDALKLIESLPAPSAALRSSMEYLKARALEESGQTKKALEIYQSVIEREPRHKVSRRANERIFLIAARSLDAQDIIALTLRNNEKIQDENLPKMIDTYLKIQSLSGKNDEYFKTLSKSNNLVSYETLLLDKSGLFQYLNKKIIHRPLVLEPLTQLGQTTAKEVKVKIITRKYDILNGILITADQNTITIKNVMGVLKINRRDILEYREERSR